MSRSTNPIFFVSVIAAAVVSMASPAQAGLTVPSWQFTAQVTHPNDNPPPDTLIQTQTDSGTFPTLPTFLGQGVALTDTTTTNSFAMTDSGHFAGWTHIHDDTGEAETIGTYEFQVTTTSSYTLSGDYFLTGLSGLSLQVSIQDNTASTALFDMNYDSLATPNQAYVVGDPLPSGATGAASGSLTGTLLPGHDYTFAYDANLFQSPGNPASATANGFVNLQIQAIPEPGTFLMTLLGGLVLLVPRFRRGKP